MTTTQTQHDPRALQIARSLHREVRPAITILFGSRARGDYVDGRSDIDIMLVQETLPPGEEQLAIKRKLPPGPRSSTANILRYGWSGRLPKSSTKCAAPSTTSPSTPCGRES